MLRLNVDKSLSRLKNFSGIRAARQIARLWAQAQAENDQIALDAVEQGHAR